jgi:hypothetical protein
MPYPDDELFFAGLFSRSESAEKKPPASLKARLYSALIRAQQASGPLASLDTTAASHDLCVFETLVQIAPVGERAKSPFFCHVCHARVLAEAFDNPPIFWPNCPYSNFKKG